ncbi:MAG TPA: GNAT family N-acetyltransferase [Anaerolineae bacterium]|jgi:GNAT superfamily N-acetyltransferase|nr:GNAT family N-acetyltransferase [Anaerolineae bacterium]
MNHSQDITILPFRSENQTEVRNLVLAGLAEHWGKLDPDKNPDLDDIALTYADAVFLVAWQDDKIIGTGALVPRSAEIAEIVRMSVAANLRRNGVGRKILQRLCERAKSDGYKRLVLETTDTWHEVIEFYKKFGFQISHYLDGDVYFVRDISNPGE